MHDRTKPYTHRTFLVNLSGRSLFRDSNIKSDPNKSENRALLRIETNICSPPNTNTPRTKPAMSPPDYRRFFSQTGFLGPDVPSHAHGHRNPPPAFVPAQPPPPPGLPPSREGLSWDALAARLQVEP